MRLLPLIVGSALSPTRLVIDDIKARHDDAANVLWNWNLWFFRFELGVCLSLVVYPFVLPGVALPVLLMFVLLWLALSRCNEIAFAFYRDTIDHLKKERKTSLKPWQRIQMAVRSYLSLTANFGMVCYFVPTLYDPAPNNFVQALYFSGVTIATLGYGDIKPIQAVSQLLAVYEVFSGILLVVLALGTYLASHDK